MSKLNKYKLSEIAYIEMGQSPDGESCNEAGVGIPLLNGPSEFTDFYPIPKQFTINAKRFSEEGEILFCVRGSTTGRMNWSNGTYAIGRGLASITHKEGKQLNHFLKYLIHSNLDSILKAANGSTFPNLTSDIFASFELAVPDLPTQQKIASVLSSLDAKIELNNRINAELEAMAKTLYDYWFVQFDFPDAAGKPYKSSGGAMVWSEELKREIPAGWEVKKLKSIANFTTGKLDSNAEDIRGNYLFFTCASEPTYTTQYAFDDTVVLIAGNNASGNFHINRYKGKFNAYQRTYVITAKNQKGLELIYQILKTETKLLKSKGNGSQTKFLTIGMLTDIEVAFREDVVELLFNTINPIYQKQEILKQENQQLSALRDWLLPMLMNGQVVVE